MIKSTRKTYKIFIYIFLFSIFPFGFVSAADLGSQNFKIKDSFMGSEQQMNSQNFSLNGVLSQFAEGSSIGQLFNLNSGILYFPSVTSPVVSVTAGDAKVDLSWTSSQGFLGVNVSGYLLGQSTTSGGPYSFMSVGNVTNAIKSPLLNGTKYYFIVQAQDSFGKVVATSGEVSATPQGNTTPAVPSGGGGGGGSPTISNQPTKITLKGLAYPFANIVILKDASIGAKVTADENGNFEATFPASSGVYTFGIYALDKDGHKSTTFSFTVNSMSNQTVTTSDILVAPTINSDKSAVKVGNIIKFFGYTYPISSVNIEVHSKKQILDQVKADKFGRWSYSLSTADLEKGQHIAKSQTLASAELASAYSEILNFQVGDKDVLNSAAVPQNQNGKCSSHGDINNDNKINVTDFSILLYFWGKKNPANKCVDINADGTVDLKDFSVMLYWWTG